MVLGLPANATTFAGCLDTTAAAVAPVVAAVNACVCGTAYTMVYKMIKMLT